MKSRLLGLALLGFSTLCASNIEAQEIGLEIAQGERLATAVGHYARARSLLNAAIREFDKGYQLANPDALLNSDEWRKDLVDRATELERVLDPQPRITRGGVKYNADNRLLHEAN